MLATEGNECHADLSIIGKTKHLVGTIDGQEVTFEGSINMPFPIGKTNFTLTGTVEGDVLTGVCKTKKFSFDVNGTRVS